MLQISRNLFAKKPRSLSVSTVHGACRSDDHYNPVVLYLNVTATELELWCPILKKVVVDRLVSWHGLAGTRIVVSAMAAMQRVLYDLVLLYIPLYPYEHLHFILH